jgi:drug/metabolite transporter (DMT)-like permease
MGIHDNQSSSTAAAGDVNVASAGRPAGAAPYAALAVAVVSISTGAIFVRLANAHALVIAAYRVGIAALILAPFALTRCRDELRSLTRRDLLLTLAAGVALAVHFATWIASLGMTTVAASVVLVNTNPVWVGLLSPLVASERIGRKTAIGIAISVVGAVILGAGDFLKEGHAIHGDLLALCGGVFYAFYLLLGRSLRRRLTLVAYAFVCYSTAAVILIVAVLVMGLQFHGFERSTMLALIALAVVSQLGGHTTYNWALKYFSAGVIAVVLLGEPIGSTLLAWVVLHETPPASTAAGGVLIILAIYLAATDRRAEVREASSG